MIINTVYNTKDNSSTGPTVKPKDVNFIDYDGTLLYSYTLAEAAALTELPALPSHDGLICQGWNWTLDYLKMHIEQSSTMVQITVGAIYNTDDGKTRIYINIINDERKTIDLTISGQTIFVNWGDGSDTESVTNYRFSHTYANIGNYMITLQSENPYDLGVYEEREAIVGHSSNDYYRSIRNMVKKIELGDNARISHMSFQYLSSLETITIPYNAMEVSDSDKCVYLGESAFCGCYSLHCIIIPGVPNEGNNGNSYSIQYGDKTFYGCTNLKTISLPPMTVLQGFGIATFALCVSLQNITIPFTNKIDSNLFAGCSGLTKLVFPYYTHNVGSQAFGSCPLTADDSNVPNCAGIKIFDFSSNKYIEGYNVDPIVPVLENINAFDGCSSDFIIRVDSTMLNKWKTATNWSKYADHIVGV